MRASVWASSVLPQPVGPISRMFDFASSTSLFRGRVVQALVVVVDGDREHLLGVVLADHVVVQDLVDLERRRHAVARLHQRGLVLLADDVHAQLDAFVADEDGRAGDQLADLVLALAAEGAIERVLALPAAADPLILLISTLAQYARARIDAIAATCAQHCSHRTILARKIFKINLMASQLRIVEIPFRPRLSAICSSASRVVITSSTRPKSRACSAFMK